jgi:hypothetical protein
VPIRQPWTRGFLVPLQEVTQTDLSMQIASDSGATKKWLHANAPKACRAVANPSVRAAVSALLVGSDPETERERRLERVECELDAMELRWSWKRRGKS